MWQDTTVISSYLGRAHELGPHLIPTAPAQNTACRKHGPADRSQGGHESAGLTLDRYGHLGRSDVEAVGAAINQLLTRNCGQSVGTQAISVPKLRALDSA
jgi:hypothetical protein